MSQSLESRCIVPHAIPVIEDCPSLLHQGHVLQGGGERDSDRGSSRGSSTATYNGPTIQRVNVSAVRKRPTPAHQPLLQGRETKRVSAAGVLKTLSKSRDVDTAIARWTGGVPQEIDGDLMRQCTVGSADGTVTDLNFHFKFLKRISGLGSHGKYLQTLDMSSNNIRRIENMNDMIRLQVLKLCGCEISQIENLDFCTQLTALHLQDNRITTIDGLGCLRVLEHLNLDSNRIGAVGRGLAGLDKLKELHLSYNQLSSFSGLCGLRALETLTMSGNRLHAISASQLNGMQRLDELRLAHNSLKSLSFLRKGESKLMLPRLAALDVASNALTTVELKEMPRLPRLAELDLSSNQIARLPDQLAAKLPAIEILDVSRNQLESIADLDQFENALSLRELLLHSNPGTLPLIGSASGLANLGASDDNPLEHLLAKLPALELLDGKHLQKKAAGSGGEEGQGTGGTFHLTLALNTGLSSPQQSQPSVALPKLPKHRFAAEDQVDKWQQRAMEGFASVARDIERTVHQSKSDLEDMDSFLKNCRRVLDWEREQRQPSLRALKEPVMSKPTLPRPTEHKGLVQLDAEVLGAKGSSAAVHKSPFDSWLQHPAGEVEEEASERTFDAGPSHDTLQLSCNAATRSSGQPGRRGRCVTLGNKDRRFNKLSSHTNCSSTASGHLSVANTNVSDSSDHRGNCYITAVRLSEEVNEHVTEPRRGWLLAKSEAVDFEEVAEELQTDCEMQFERAADALGDLAEVEEEIGQDSDNTGVKEATSRLCSVRAARKHAKMCRSRPEKSHCKNDTSLLRPLPFPSFHAPPGL